MPEASKKSEYFNCWEVVARTGVNNGFANHTKFQVNSRQCDPAVVAENFNKSSKHPHKDAGIEAVHVYPVDKSGQKIDGGPVWNLQQPAKSEQTEQP